MGNAAFRFLLWDNGLPYQSSRCYVVADPSINDRKQWSLQLEPPEDASWVYEIDDIKDWMLHGKPKRQIIFDRLNPRTPFRDLERDDVFREYLRKILERIPAEHQERRKYALMPSIADDESRTRYKDAVEAAIPGVMVLPEPEMVAEYFRLLERNLELEAGKNNVILVVDVGASTANMTLIVSRRDSTILDADKRGAQRDLRLRALRGDSDDHAGRWVDRRIAQRLGLEISDAVLRDVERAKIAANTGELIAVDPLVRELPRIDNELLVSVSEELWGSLVPLFDKLCERLYENQTSTQDARRLSAERLRERNVTNPQDAYRLIDTVLLAGGTSLLPGFEEAMQSTLFPDGHRPTVLRVGNSFPIVAAAGGLAHILHNYSPPRLRESSGPSSQTFTASLEATLPHPLLLGLKDTGEFEHYVTLLDPNDRFVDDGGTRAIEGLPSLAPGSTPKARLVPALSAGMDARRGRRFRPLHVHRAPGKMTLEWDPVSQRASISSDQVGETGHLWIDASTLRKRSEPALNPFDERLPPNALAVDEADDIIFDLGMSKIVAVTADRGWVSTDELERVVEEGEPAAADVLTLFRGDHSLDLDRAVEVPENVPPEDNLEDSVPVPSSSFETQNEWGQEIEIVTDDSVSDKPLRDFEEIDARDRIGLPPSPRPDNLPSNLAAAPINEPMATPLPQPRGCDWTARIPDSEFSHALVSLRDALFAEAPQIRFDDIVVALLGLSIRPIVLLAGPPGCGKSTLVRLIARVMGKTSGVNFHDVAVQAHWVNDDALFSQDKTGILSPILDQRGDAHLILFDEFNLTRPEYYLSRFFHALDNGEGALSRDTYIEPCRVFGTLNIDESSRPPSPKVIDRCFLMELAQVAHDSGVAAELPALNDLPLIPGLPAVAGLGASTDDQINGILHALHLAVHDNDLRHDILPSHRVLSDIRSSLSLHHRLDLQAKGLLDRRDLVDRLIASRILVKVAGAFDQLSPALDALEGFIEDGEELPRSRRRLKLARQQARLGFISPWQ